MVSSGLRSAKPGRLGRTFLAGRKLILVLLSVVGSAYMLTSDNWMCPPDFIREDTSWLPANSAGSLSFLTRYWRGEEEATERDL